MGITLKSRRSEQLTKLQQKVLLPEVGDTWKEGERSSEKRSREKWVKVRVC